MSRHIWKASLAAKLEKDNAVYFVHGTRTYASGEKGYVAYGPYLTVGAARGQRSRMEGRLRWYAIPGASYLVEVLRFPLGEVEVLP